MKVARKSRYHLLAFLVVAIWGVTFISTKVLILAGLRPSAIFFIRFVTAYICIWIFGLKHKSSRKLFSGNVKDEALFLVLGITGGSIYFLSENTALAYTQACNVSFIVCSAPLITALLTLAFKSLFRGPLSEGLEDIGGRGWLFVGSVLAMAGMAAVIFDGAALHFSAKGDLCALGAAICWGIYSIFMSQMTAKYGTVFATRKVFFYGLVTILPFLPLQELEMTSLLQPEVWGNLIFLSLVASFGCFVLWNRIMAELGNVTSTNYVYLNPFFTLVTAVIFLGESLTLQSGLGCAAIFAGVLLGNHRAQKSH